MTQTWRVDAGPQTLVLASFEGEIPSVVYWGPALPDKENLKVLAEATRRDITGGMMDTVPPLSLCPQEADAFLGQPGFVAHISDGTAVRPRFVLESVEGSDELVIRCCDKAHGLQYTATLSAHDTGVIALDAQIKSQAALHISWLAAPVMPAPALADSYQDYSGRWCREFQPNALDWAPGARLRESRSGRTGHETFPSLVVPTRGATHDTGGCYGFHYGWSGGHRMVAEELPDGRRQVQFGHATQSDVPSIKEVSTATLYIGYSDAGLNGLSEIFQSHVVSKIVRFPEPERPRPVHYNCWEAIYFDHDLETLTTIADLAADIGAERFVLDDGWFGHRDDDTTSLGDWDVDHRKYPYGLRPLVDHILDLGMTFGIWFEPEMINRESTLFKAHPDWVLGPEDQPIGRQQLVLDISREDVRDYLFGKMDVILSDIPVDYVKWDHNRVLPYNTARQTEGLYALLDRITAAHPKVEFETCASGGGRIDYGILERTQRLWLSDSNDALERLEIQANAAQFLPDVIVGSHVGPRVCHTSGRVFTIGFRAWVAAMRHMGFEMDPRELTEAERDVLKDITSWWKDNRDWLFQTPSKRISTADPAIIAEMRVSEDQSKFATFIGKTGTSRQTLTLPIQLIGLREDVTYTVSLRYHDGALALSRGHIPLKDGQIQLSGKALMSMGVQLPMQNPASMMILEGERVA